MQRTVNKRHEYKTKSTEHLRTFVVCTRLVNIHISRTMVAYTVPMLVVLLVASQCLLAYPSDAAAGFKNNYRTNFRLKRDFGYLQRHELANLLNEEMPASLDDGLALAYAPAHRQARKRLIDF